MPYCCYHSPSNTVPYPQHLLNKSARVAMALGVVVARFDLHETAPAGEPMGQIIITEETSWVDDLMVHYILS